MTVREIWNRRENLGGDPVDWSESIPIGSSQTVNFHDIPLESIDLEGCKNPSMRSVSWFLFTSSWPRPIAML